VPVEVRDFVGDTALLEAGLKNAEAVSRKVVKYGGAKWQILQ
jgi:hypothetical protein